MAGVIIHNEEAGMPSSYMQVFKLATISSVQILVLVIAGTSGFIVSLLGLIIPDALKGGKPSTTSASSSRPSSLRSRRNRSTSPTVSSSRRTSSPPSLRRGVVTKRSSIEHGLHSILDQSENGIASKSLPMSRGDSGHSDVTVPELGGGQSTSNTSTSCSSSISDTARVTSSTTHHHHGISANALYEGLVNRYKSKKATCKKQDSPPRVSTGTAPSTAVSNEEQASTTRTGRRASITASPKSSHEGMRSRLSSLMIPHSSAHTATVNNNKRLSLDSQMLHSASTGEISPKSLSSITDGPDRIATLEDVVAHTSMEKEGSHAKPPFLSRMFTFSSSSSSSSSSEPKSAGSSSSSSSIPNAKQAFPSMTSKDASDGNVRPRARRLSTRLVSFRSTSNNGSKSCRAISESSENIPHPAAMLLQEEEGDDTITTQAGELTSPPQTPRLGTLPSAAEWTPGSNASPLRSPLSKRSFFGGMSSNSPSKNSNTSSSPANSTLTPKSNNVQQQGRLGKGPSPKAKIERPTLGRRSASDNHTITTAASSSSWKHWVTSTTSPGKVSRRGTVSVSSTSVVEHPAALREQISAKVEDKVKHGHARHVSDHAVLPNRAFPLASSSMSPPHSSSTQSQTQRPRQTVSYRALSYAPPPSHAVLVPLSSTTAAYPNNMHLSRHQQLNGNPAAVVGHHHQRVNKPFVPFHPFLDERYHESSLDLSGTSGLTMEVHFSGSPSASASVDVAR